MVYLIFAYLRDASSDMQSYHNYKSPRFGAGGDPLHIDFIYIDISTSTGAGGDLLYIEISQYYPPAPPENLPLSTMSHHVTKPPPAPALVEIHFT